MKVRVFASPKQRRVTVGSVREACTGNIRMQVAEVSGAVDTLVDLMNRHRTSVPVAEAVSLALLNLGVDCRGV